MGTRRNMGQSFQQGYYEGSNQIVPSIVRVMYLITIWSMMPKLYEFIHFHCSEGAVTDQTMNFHQRCPRILVN